MASEVAVSLPFGIDSYGQVATATTQSDIWAGRGLSVMGTALRERIFRPSFGTLIPFFMFETTDTATKEITNEVHKAFATQLSLLTLVRVDITLDNYSQDTYTDSTSDRLKVSIQYSLPNNDQQTTVVGFVIVNQKNPIYEELA